MIWVDCGFEKVGSILEIVVLLKVVVVDFFVGCLVCGYGYEQWNFVEKWYFMWFEFDEVVVDCEVYFMNVFGYGGVVNLYMFEFNGVDWDILNLDGGEFFCDVDGDFIGELFDVVCNIFIGVYGVKIGYYGLNFYFVDELEEYLCQFDVVMQWFFVGGVILIGDCQVMWCEFDMYLWLVEVGWLELCVLMYLLLYLFDEVLEMGLVGQFGNVYLSFVGIKFYVDGIFGGWIVYFLDGYVGDFCCIGQFYYEFVDYVEFICKVYVVGLQIVMYVQLFIVIEMVVLVVEVVLVECLDVDVWYCIEYCGLLMLVQIEWMVVVGICFVNQMQYYFNWGEGVEEVIGIFGECFNFFGEFECVGVFMMIFLDVLVVELILLEVIQIVVIWVI